MNDYIQFQSRVDDDGILNVQINLGRIEAKKDVVVTIAPLPANDESNQPASMSWPDFIEQTYGSCADFGLDRPEQGSFEQREPMA